jgi:hypothetical protein
MKSNSHKLQHCDIIRQLKNTHLRKPNKIIGIKHFLHLFNFDRPKVTAYVLKNKLTYKKIIEKEIA